MYETFISTIEQQEIQAIETVVQQQKVIALREVKERRIKRRKAKRKMRVLKKMEYSIRNAKTTLNLDQLRKDYVQFQEVFNISTENAIGTDDVHLDTSTPDDPENNPSELNDAFDENEEDNAAAEAEIRNQEDAIEEMPPMTSDTTETEEDAAVELDEDQLPENQDVGKSTKEGEPPRDLTNIYRYDP
jgi:cobalamin biosynthesis protein CobT